MKRLTIILVVIGVLCGAWSLGWNYYSSALEAQDRALVAKLDALLKDELARNRELTEEHGAFLRLEGSSFRRATGWVLLERIEITRTAVFADGNILLTSNLFCSPSLNLGKEEIGIQRWEYQPGRPQLKVDAGTLIGKIGELPRPPVSAVALSADGGLVFTGRDGEIEIRDRKTKKLTWSVKGHFGTVHEFAYADGARQLAARCDTSLRLIDLATGQEFSWFPMHQAYTMPAKRIAISRDGEQLLGDFILPNRQEKIMKMIKGRVAQAPLPLAGLADPEKNITALEAITVWGDSNPECLLSPDGRWAILGLRDSGRELWWDLAGTKLLHDIAARRPGEWKGSGIFGPKSGHLFLLREDGTNALAPQRLEFPSGNVLTKLEEPREMTSPSHPVPLAVSPDEQWLAMLTGGGVLIWHLPSGRLMDGLHREHWIADGLLEPPAAGSPAADDLASESSSPYPTGYLPCLAFESGNRLIAACATGPTVRLWHMDPESWDAPTRALRPGVPRSFSWNYTFPPEPGKRRWSRVGEMDFHETYPSGQTIVFRIRETMVVDQITGTLAQKEGSPLEVFIPDKGSAGMHLKMRGGPASRWAFMGMMQEVE